MNKPNSSLPGGGSISEILVESAFGVIVLIIGVDNNEDSFSSKYNIEKDQISHTLTKPKMTEADIAVLYETGRSFARSYGY